MLPLQLPNQLHILRLRLLWLHTLVDDLLPGLALRFALHVTRRISLVFTHSVYQGKEQGA